MRVERCDVLASALHLRPSDIGRRMRHLSLQIAEGHRVVVDDAETADASRREILDQRRPKPARADDQHAGLAQPLLTGATNVLEDKVALVTLDLVGRELLRFGGVRHGGNIPLATAMGNRFRYRFEPLIAQASGSRNRSDV
jgi:hypothetical protein